MYPDLLPFHYDDVIMTTIASQITSLTVVYSTVYSDAVQSKHQSSASLDFVWGIHRDRWIPRTKGQLRGKCVHWWRHHVVFNPPLRLCFQRWRCAIPCRFNNDCNFPHQVIHPWRWYNHKQAMGSAWSSQTTPPFLLGWHNNVCSLKLLHNMAQVWYSQAM